MIPELEIEEIKKRLDKLQEDISYIRSWQQSPKIRSDNIYWKVEKLTKKLKKLSKK